MDHSQKIDEIKDKLKTIFDPEIPVDIYELRSEEHTSELQSR